MQKVEINKNVHSLNDRVQWEFKSIEKYLVGKGIDVGCGTNRLSHSILAIDQQPNQEYAHADVIHDCKDLDIKDPFEFKGEVYHFKKNELDFIFSSHCLEDFEDIKKVFLNWWQKLKANGLMLLLLPDMQGGRYPKVNELHGNPAHRTDVGLPFITEMLEALNIKYEMIQSDTLPHNKTCSIDFVIRKIGD